ncbi:MAG: hypothetical protein KKA78_17260 [Alphaproteobacteria bacterium]|nr:hypothetical protein [Alphaproteobacteria bacterium]
MTLPDIVVPLTGPLDPCLRSFDGGLRALDRGFRTFDEAPEPGLVSVVVRHGCKTLFASTRFTTLGLYRLMAA